MPTSAASNAGSKANENRSAAADAGSKGGASSSGGSKSGGGKMGASSSQSGGTKSSAATAGSKSSASSSTGRGPAASKAAASAGTKAASKSPSSGPGGAGGVRNTSSGTRPSSTAAKVGGTIGTNPSKVAQSGGLLGGYSGPKGVPSKGLNPAARNAATGPFGSNFRGPLGPHGELRTGITPETRAYQNAEIARAAYPDTFGRYSQKQVADFMNALANVTPFEADVNRYGTPAMNPIARTAINQVLAGQQWDSKRHIASAVPAGLAKTSLGAALAGLDTQQARVGTLGLNVSPSPPGTPMHTMADMAIGDALQQRGVPAGLMNANNFVAKGTPNVPGTNPIGTYRGTTYATDPTSGISNRVSAANRQAASILGGPAAVGPSLASTPSTSQPPSLDAQIAAMQARSPTAGLRAAAVPQSREQMAGLTGNLDSFNSMDMGGYRSPMTGLTGMPQAPSNMNMSGYQSPMTGLSGMPPAPGTMNMSGYQSPMVGTTGMPQANPAGMGNYRSPMTGLGGMPNVPANMNMGGYTSPMAQVGALPGPRNPASGMSFNPGMPRNPQSGMSFTPGLPRNPESGMSFNPSMPRNPVGGMSFTPGLPGQMPGPERSRSPAVSAPEDDLVAGYSNPSRSFAGIPANSLPNLGKVDPEINPQDDPMDPIDVANYDPLSSISPPVPGMPMDINPQLQNYPQPYMGERYTFSVPGRPKGTRRSVAPTDRVTEGVLTGALGLGTGVPGSGLVLDAMQSLGAMGRQGRLGNRPGQPYANGMDHGDTYQGGSGANNNQPTVWTGRESPAQVANMQQHVEQVLRGYFIQMPGQQYPQYTTG